MTTVIILTTAMFQRLSIALQRGNAVPLRSPSWLHLTPCDTPFDSSKESQIRKNPSFDTYKTGIPQVLQLQFFGGGVMAHP